MVQPTGMEVARYLNINSQQYDITQAFSTLQPIEWSDYCKLNEPDRKQRVQAFYSYLSAQLGFDVEAAAEPSMLDIRTSIACGEAAVYITYSDNGFTKQVLVNDYITYT